VGSHHPIWVYCGLFDLEETIRGVCWSAPAGCSPRGLGGMSYPFKDFGIERVGPPVEDKGSCQAVAVVALRVPTRGKVRGCLVFASVGSWATGAQSIAFSHGSVVMIKWGVSRL
jgi:hypothetical protein